MYYSKPSNNELVKYLVTSVRIHKIQKILKLI
jgi:hypothetical protein